MHEALYIIVAAVAIPGVIAAGVYIMPTKEDLQTQRINAHLEKQQEKKESKVAGLFSKDKDEKTQLVVLQPFVVLGGVFSIHLEAIGDESRNALCTSLPIVHDAVLTELHDFSEDPAMQPPGENLKDYADAIRRKINETFGRAVVSGVILAYADMKTFNGNYRRMQTGSSKRCVTSRT